MIEANAKSPAPKTAAVTAVGCAVLAFGVLNLLAAGNLIIWPDSEDTLGLARPAIMVVIGVLFGSIGLATVRRSRGWATWYGALAWGAIIFVGLGLVPLMHTSRAGESTPEGVLTLYLTFAFIVVAIAILALLAKRRELRATS
jgi:hypothetical protein